MTSLDRNWRRDMNDKIFSFLGLCQKAGQLVHGEDGCEAAVKSGKARLLLVAEDAGGNTKKKFRNMADFYKVELFLFGEKETLGRALGKAGRAVLVVTEDGFAKKIKEYLTH